MGFAQERDLYPPVKRFLEGQGYEVKGEITGCDLVARRGEEPPVIVELKLRFNLELILQGVDRLGLSDAVYLAVPAPAPTDRRMVQLCRRLGLGLLRVEVGGGVEPMVDPVPYRPRKVARRVGRLLREHARRVGDPNAGGSAMRGGIVTAYRQEALRIAAHLAAHGPQRPRDLKVQATAPNAGTILRSDFYGWFERVAPATYDLTPKGRAVLADPG